MQRGGRASDGRWYAGRGDGRGVWWCRGTGCVERLSVAHLARALKCAVNDGDLAQLRAAVTGS